MRAALDARPSLKRLFCLLCRVASAGTKGSTLSRITMVLMQVLLNTLLHSYTYLTAVQPHC